MQWFLIFMLTFPAAAGRRNQTIEPPQPPVRPIPYEQPKAEPLSEGSLWTEVPARQMMGNLDANTSTSKNSSTSAAISALLGADKTLLAAHPNLGESIEIGATSQNAFDGKGSTGRDSTIDAVLTCEVIEVQPGGNLRVWGWKQVRVNREIQYLVVEGVARPRDIQMDNTINSNLLAKAKIEVTGSGVVADKQGPGLGTRLLDRLWPF